MIEDFKQCRPIDKAVFIMLVACNVVALFLLGRAYYGNPDATISAIKDQQQAITGQIASSRNDVVAARQTTAAASTGIDRVQARIEQSANIARANTEQLDKCRKLIAECRNIARHNGEIISGARAANSAGAQKAEIHTK